MSEPTNGMMPPNDAGKFDEHVAATIRAAFDEWKTHSDPFDPDCVSMPEYIRRALADASLLAPNHLTHSLCLKWDDTCEGFTIISDGAEAGQVVVLADTVRQVMEERDLPLALQRAGFRSMKDQVDAMSRRIRELDAEVERLQASRFAWAREADRQEQRADVVDFMMTGTIKVMDREQAEANLATETLGAIWLYVDWRYVTRQLTTEQKELWADAVDAFGDPEHVEPKAERWWRDDFVERRRG